MTFLVTLTCDSTLLFKILAFLDQFEYIVTCQAHPVLVKMGQMYSPFLFKKFLGNYC